MQEDSLYTYHPLPIPQQPFNFLWAQHCPRNQNNSVAYFTSLVIHFSSHMVRILRFYDLGLFFFFWHLTLSFLKFCWEILHSPWLSFQLFLSHFQFILFPIMPYMVPYNLPILESTFPRLSRMYIKVNLHVFEFCPSGTQGWRKISELY